ncbi:hypothetical protein [Treponema sp. R6D11]
MTIEQTVEIPANRRLTLDLSLPETLPWGEAKVKLSIKPFGKRRKKTFIESLGPLCGCLKTSTVFEGNPVEIQKQMRAEWDRSWENNV